MSIEEVIPLKALSDINISDYREAEAEDFHADTAEFLHNCAVHEDISGINYMKVGELYYISGSVEFTEIKLNILPEPAKTDGFINTSSGEILLLKAGSTEIEATEIGIKIISGFYVAQKQEH